MGDVQYASSAMPTYFPHPRWHPMYSHACDAVKVVLKLRAVNLYKTTKAAISIKLADETRESGALHFETLSTCAPIGMTVDAAVRLPTCPALDESDVVLNNVLS